MSEEVRTVNARTGAEKGAKVERFDLIPVGALAELARLYGKGAEKYAENNWRRGYDYSLSYAALQRHANLWWSGEDDDPETGLSHMAAVAWHAFTLMTLLVEHPELDDRYVATSPGEPEDGRDDRDERAVSLDEQMGSAVRKALSDFASANTVRVDPPSDAVRLQPSVEVLRTELADHQDRIGF